MRLLKHFPVLFCLINRISSANAVTERHGQFQEQSHPLPDNSQKLATTPIYLTELARIEEVIYNDLKNSSEYVDWKPPKLQRYIKEYGEGRKGLRTPEAVASNPLASIKMLRRLSKTLRKVFNELEDTQIIERLNTLSFVREDLLPNKEQYHEAIGGLLQLQYFYDLKPEELAEGKISTKETSLKLFVEEVFDISMFCVYKKYYSLAPGWLRLLNSRLLPTNGTGWNKGVKKLGDMLIEMHNKDFDQGNQDFTTFMFENYLTTLDHLPQTMRDGILKASPKDDRWLYGENGLVLPSQIKLCNGVHLMTAKERSRLKCWLDAKRDPFFYIRPLKIEALHLNPDLLQFHDVIPDSWIQDMRVTASPKSFRPPPRGSIEETYRSASYAWLMDEDLPKSPIRRLQELMFNVHSRGNASDLLQIASYTLGAHVSLHVDYWASEPPLDSTGRDAKGKAILKRLQENPQGDRVSTFLAYLTDVEMGGYTVFPRLKAFVRPLKGSVVHWYNTHRNMQAITEVLHSACPVIGEKWIATNWVYQYPNFLKRPCALNPNE